MTWLHGDKRSEELNASKEEIEEFLHIAYSDPKWEEELGSLEISCADLRNWLSALMMGKPHGRRLMTHLEGQGKI